MIRRLLHLLVGRASRPSPDNGQDARSTIYRRLLIFHRDRQGATMLEWTLLLAAIALPAYAIIRLALVVLIAHYQMITMLNGLPFP